MPRIKKNTPGCCGCGPVLCRDDDDVLRTFKPKTITITLESASPSTEIYAGKDGLYFFKISDISFIIGNYIHNRVATDGDTSTCFNRIVKQFEAELDIEVYEILSSDFLACPTSTSLLGTVTQTVEVFSGYTFIEAVNPGAGFYVFVYIQTKDGSFTSQVSVDISSFGPSLVLRSPIAFGAFDPSSLDLTGVVLCRGGNMAFQEVGIRSTEGSFCDGYESYPGIGGSYTFDRLCTV